jgi:hypothetical protein
MKQKRGKPEEIIRLLRECDGSGLSQEQFCQQKQISIAILHRCERRRTAGSWRVRLWPLKAAASAKSAGCSNCTARPIVTVRRLRALCWNTFNESLVGGCLGRVGACPDDLA